MEYKRFGDKIFVRLDRGEEILGQVEALARREGIRLASVQALGALDDFTVGVFDTASKQFRPNHFSGPYEIVSLTGTIDQMDGRPYIHLHLSAGDAKGQVVGGHLKRAVVSATCEMVLALAEGELGRAFDPETGLNLWKF